MNKADLIKVVAKKADLTQSEAKLALDALIASITESLKAGDSVTLVGFGTFSVADRPAREGRNPATGETMQIPAKRVPVFKAGKSLKEAITETIHAAAQN